MITKHETELQKSVRAPIEQAGRPTSVVPAKLKRQSGVAYGKNISKCDMAN